MRFFNTAGPINSAEHYFVPHRFDNLTIHQLISQKKYFILHAPRQSGKTTGMLELVKQLNQEGQFKALYVNFEPLQAARGKYEQGIFAAIKLIQEAQKTQLQDGEVIDDFPISSGPGSALQALQQFLSDWAQRCPKPIVLFIDEIDSLIGDTLISVLRQLRAGYTNRPRYFPQSLCLIGVRDVRDYRIWSDEEHATVLGGSAFNIKAESLTLYNAPQF